MSSDLKSFHLTVTAPIRGLFILLSTQTLTLSQDRLLENDGALQLVLEVFYERQHVMVVLLYALVTVASVSMFQVSLPERYFSVLHCLKGPGKSYDSLR